MKHALILISLLTWPLQAELDSPAKEWEFAVAQKNPIILHAGSGEVVPAMPTLAGGALFFTDCSATGRAPCQNIYRLTAADTQPQRVVETKEVQRLFTQNNKVFAQLATDTILYVLQDDKLVPWKTGERSQAEAGARFHLHALASSDTSLPADVYRNPLLRPALSANGEGFGFQIFSSDQKNPLLLGFLHFNPKTPPALMPFTQNTGTLVAPSASQFYLTTDSRAPDGGELGGLVQVNLAQKTSTALGGDPAGTVEASEELLQANWKARTLSHVSATPQGGLLVATSTNEPGEVGRVWYFPSDNFAEAGKVRAVRSVAEPDLGSVQMTPHGILATHKTDKTIALYPAPGAFETAALASWKKKSELLTKAWNISPKDPCGAYVLVKHEHTWEIRFRERGADSVPSYRSLLTFAPHTAAGGWVCDPKQGPVFLTTILTLNMRQDSLQINLDASSLYGSNDGDLINLTKRIAAQGAAADHPRLPFSAGTFRWDTPRLFQLRGPKLTLARAPLAGSQFASLTAGQDATEVRLQTASTPPVPFEDYMHSIPHGRAEFLPVNYSAPPPDQGAKK